MADWLDQTGIGTLHQILKERQGLTTNDLANEYQGLVNERYGQQTPYELNKLFQANEHQRLVNRKAQGTLETDISATNTKNTTDELTNKTKASIERNNLLLEAYTMGGKPELARRAKELGVSKDVFDKLINVDNPGESLAKNREDLMKRLSITSENIFKKETASTLAETEKQKAEQAHKDKLEELGITGKTQRDVANIYASQRAATAVAKGTPALTSDKVFAAIVAKQAQGETLTPQEWQALETIARLKAAGKQQDVTIDPSGKLVPKGESTDIIPKPKQPTANTLDSVKKMYPGVPEDKLKEAYKQKFGVDLK